MAISGITTKIFSTIENPKSVLPIIMKDGVDSSCVTYKAFQAGGAVEGIDRGMDEFGTQAIWVGGIPFFKKLIDKTVYKFAKINPDVDVRIIGNKEYSAWAVKNAKGVMNGAEETVKDALETALKNPNKSKALYGAKIALATALTLFSYFKLTHARHKNTENIINKEINSEKNFAAQTETKAVSDKKINVTSNLAFMKSPKTSFKGLGAKVVKGVLFNPVHNMKIIDAGITTERLAAARNKTEFFETAIKEGSFLFFVYGFGNLIQKGINKLAASKFKTPIDLNYNVITSPELKQAMKEDVLTSQLGAMGEGGLTKTLDFIVQNPKNILVQAAKKTGLVNTLKGTDTVDVTKYIDVKEVKTLKDSLDSFQSAMKSSGLGVDEFLNKAKKLKSLSIVANIGLSCLVLGYGIPKAVYQYRKWKTGSSSFHVANDIKNKNQQA
ncbi:hypothetical protein IKQ26_04630 [bacterium]|nr:hypothetical protein [bacterium]